MDDDARGGYEACNNNAAAARTLNLNLPGASLRRRLLRQPAPVKPLLRLIEPGKHGEIRFDTLPVDVVQSGGDVFATVSTSPLPSLSSYTL